MKHISQIKIIPLPGYTNKQHLQPPPRSDSCPRNWLSGPKRHPCCQLSPSPKKNAHGSTIPLGIALKGLDPWFCSYKPCLPAPPPKPLYRIKFQQISLRASSLQNGVANPFFQTTSHLKGLHLHQPGTLNCSTKSGTWLENNNVKLMNFWAWVKKDHFVEAQFVDFWPCCWDLKNGSRSWFCSGVLIL